MNNCSQGASVKVGKRAMELKCGIPGKQLLELQMEGPSREAGSVDG